MHGQPEDVPPARAQLDEGTPNYGLAVFLALAVACTAVWASLAGQLVAAFQAAPRGALLFHRRRLLQALELQRRQSVVDG